MSTSRHQATYRSAIWAAYGDALGFMTELAKDTSGIKHRTGQEIVTGLLPWRRMLGGIYGTSVELCSGCYSDDTQLRLSTSRSINKYGFFDVEAFAKFELTVWQSYALGAGRGTKAAAQSLTQKNRNWFNNFYSLKNSEYINGGGNGAAMRIQPHVWAAQTLSNAESFLIDVVKNSITTHGHPRGIAGAVFHAAALASLLNGNPVTFDVLKQIAVSCQDIPKLILSDDYLSSMWLPEWEERSSIDIHTAFKSVSNELLADLSIVEPWVNSEGLAYSNLITSLQLDNPELRGSGTKTALIASLLTLKLSDIHIQNIMLEVVNHLDTDTDTIATMFGALAGIISNDLPPEEVQDQSYIQTDAERLYWLSQGKEVEGFVYPNLTQWTPERSAISNVRLESNILKLNGFGAVTPKRNPFNGKQKNFSYQWVDVTSQGFQVLLKIKRQDVQINVFNDNSIEVQGNHRRNNEENNNIPCAPQQQSLMFESHEDAPKTSENIDSLTKEAIKSQFNPTIIGEHILLLSQKDELAIESVISYSSIVAKAKISRDQKVKQS
ncbi:TPA: ADP-ribosylglycohydrolase family protein [Photobacterium damselae]